MIFLSRSRNTTSNLRSASGIAISFCDTEEREYLKDIQKLIKITLPVVKGHEFESTNPLLQPTLLQKPKPAPRGRFRDQKSSYNRSRQSK
jgi:ATP-dependent RNA helicase RhlE